MIISVCQTISCDFSVKEPYQVLIKRDMFFVPAPDTLLTNPDGHGGCFTALVNTGTLDWLQSRGVEHIIYIQVDNVLVPVDDPSLLGFAVSRQAEVVTKVLEKAFPDEKLGHLVQIEGHDHIIEYTELSRAGTFAWTRWSSIVSMGLTSHDVLVGSLLSALS